jgi:hypothetical protein
MVVVSPAEVMNVQKSQLIGQLPYAVGDMPALASGGAAYVFGGGSGQDLHDEILRVETDGRVEQAGRMPVALRGHQAVAVDDRSVYLLGGFADGTRADVVRLDPDGWRATPVAPMPHGSAWFAATAVGRAIYVVGGFSIPQGYWTDMAVYDVDADRWETVKEPFPTTLFPRGRLGSNAVVALEGRLLSFGGADQFDPERTRANALDVCAEYDLSQGRWRRAKGGIQAREGLVAARSGDAAYLVGGMPETSDEPSSLVERIDLGSGQVAPFGRLASGRVTPAVAAVGGRLLVIGGVTQPPFGMTADIESFDLD